MGFYFFKKGFFKKPLEDKWNFLSGKALVAGSSCRALQSWADFRLLTQQSCLLFPKRIKKQMWKVRAWSQLAQPLVPAQGGGLASAWDQIRFTGKLQNFGCRTYPADGEDSG